MVVGAFRVVTATRASYAKTGGASFKTPHHNSFGLTGFDIMDMDDGARKWLLKTARKHFWRVAVWYEFDDLIQDGMMCYYRVFVRYPKVKDRPHVMRLFQSSFINHIHDMSNRKTRQVDEPVIDEDNNPLLRETCNDAQLLRVIAEAPAPINTVLWMLIDNPGYLNRPYRIRRDGTRETTNERLCKLVGYDHVTFDMPSMIRAYLGAK